MLGTTEGTKAGRCRCAGKDIGCDVLHSKLGIARPLTLIDIPLHSQTTLSDIIEDVLASLKSKNPQVKEGTLRFLHRSLQFTISAPGKEQVKPVAEALVGLLGDSAESVRTSAADSLGTLMKILGERAFNPYIEGVGELQMTKVKDAFTKAEVRYRAGGGAKALPIGTVRPAAMAKKVTLRPCALVSLCKLIASRPLQALRILTSLHSRQLLHRLLEMVSPPLRQSEVLLQRLHLFEQSVSPTMTNSGKI